MDVLVTGCAGFIGLHVTKALLLRGHSVVGIDNLNDYYDVSLKRARLDQLRVYPRFQFEKVDITHASHVHDVFMQHKPKRVVHLAAQAGVRYSLTNPHVYGDSNLNGFLNILEECRHIEVEHLVYASSSSVYGNSTQSPFHESHQVDYPISLYAATKKANELMAHAYSHLFHMPTTGLRFFTVYGPWGRPDMALFQFAEALSSGRPIQLYHHGNMIRDFTYIDDIVEGVVRVLDKPAVSPHSCGEDLSDTSAPYLIFNIGNGQPVSLMDYVRALEIAFGVEAKKEYLPLQPGDVLVTASNTEALSHWVQFQPSTPVLTGVQHFVDWYKSYYSS